MPALGMRDFSVVRCLDEIFLSINSSFVAAFERIVRKLLLKVNEVGHEQVPHDFHGSSVLMLSTVFEQILRAYF